MVNYKSVQYWSIHSLGLFSKTCVENSTKRMKIDSKKPDIANRGMKAINELNKSW